MMALGSKRTSHASNSNILDRIIDNLRTNNLESALVFFNAMRNYYGFRHSRAFVLAVCHILARERRVGELREVLIRLAEDEGPDVAPPICDLLCNGFWKWDHDSLVWDILAFCNSKFEMVNEALYVLAKMKDLNLHVSMWTYNSLLHNLRRSKQMWKVYDEVKVTGIRGNQYTSSILINNMCRLSILPATVEYFRENECRDD